jgi:type I site-specific restriction endonuclease
MIKSLKQNEEILEKKDIINSILSEDIFDNIAVNKFEELKKLIPIIRYYDLESLIELRFLLKCENLKISILKEENIEKLTNSIASDINALNLNSTLEDVLPKKDFIKNTLKEDFWENISIEKVEKIQKELTPIIKYKKPNIPDIITSDLKDEIIERRWINY